MSKKAFAHGAMRHVSLPNVATRYRVRREARRLGIVAEPDVAEIEAAGIIAEDALFPPNGNYPVPAPFTMSFGGGTAAGSGVQLIFWGNAWNDPATSPSSAKLVADVVSILSGPWRLGLKQYGIGRIPFMGAITVADPPPPSFDSGDIDGLFIRLVDSGEIPAGQVTLYIVFTPPGVRYAPGGARGAHWAMSYEAPPLGPDTAFLGFVLNNSEAQMTATFTHELAEMLTDPLPTSGWTINGAPATISEIGDPCNQNQKGVLSGVTVQAYWSLKDNACIIPTAPSVRKTLALAGITLGSGGLRSVRDPIPSLNAFIDELYGGLFS